MSTAVANILYICFYLSLPFNVIYLALIAFFPSFFFAGERLGFEIRALCLLDECSTTGATPPNFLCFNYFLIESCTFCSGPTSDHDPPTSASQIAGITDVSRHTQPMLVFKAYKIC
jgi:hypothetical protein